MRYALVVAVFLARTLIVQAEEEPRTLAGEETFTNGLGIKMIRVPPGSFRMGDLTGNGRDDEKPLRTVELSGYYLGATEVTQAQWVRVMGRNPSTARDPAGRAPVGNVSWENAMEFCRRLTAGERSIGRLPEGHVYTLPTEAQWEYACRAGTEGDFAGDVDELAWYWENSGAGMHPVATRDANAWGFHDMHGNVWEWCRDWYRESYAGLGTLDPTGPEIGEKRVLRGGSWFDNSGAGLRSSGRGGGLPAGHSEDGGFRVALVLDVGGQE